ncbi:MAG: hypothetical protein JWQ40_4589 [Segetibacter sp.]|nr:hypothetical protein [Segetibacter sp.]
MYNDDFYEIECSSAIGISLKEILEYYTSLCQQ